VRGWYALRLGLKKNGSPGDACRKRPLLPGVWCATKLSDYLMVSRSLMRYMQQGYFLFNKENYSQAGLLFGPSKER